jgi:phosphoglycolate phosphatase
MNNNNYKVIIFDLDGTLADTSEGIINSVLYACEKLDLKTEGINLKRFIGPAPMRMYMETFNLSLDKARMATKYHRFFNNEKGFLKSKKYPKEISTLRYLSKKYDLGVVTLKNSETTKKLLEYLNINSFFKFSYGMDEKESLTKPLLLEKIVARYGKRSCLYIGDTSLDYIACCEVGIDFCFAEYGFGFLKADEVKKIKFSIKKISNLKSIL